ncbi:MAG TPA: KpsF/GutQ family sugar-phosphate isomerase [Armatimonadota bacterium]|nr:KpsF/GutQ family sugar-phosphate isomerase [Armatimonadota bacterium]
MDLSEALRKAKDAIAIEASSVEALAERIDDSFAQAVELILDCSGRVVVTGMGKSGAIGRKLAATLASTGTPSLFLHPAEGLHGDLGMVAAGDVLIVLSQSGWTNEVSAIISAMKRIGVPIIAFTGRLHSPLADQAQVTINVSVEREACPLGLAPTASTTAQLAMGDALAVAVMTARRFSREDFAALHPGGQLGHEAGKSVADLMRTNEDVAAVAEDGILRDTLFAITKAHAGAAAVLDADRRLVGIITDGDIRRALLEDAQALSRRAGEVMTRDPKIAGPEEPAIEALRLMKEYKIGDMPVLDTDRRPVGMLNLKDMLDLGME